MVETAALDHMFEALRNVQRRRLLFALLECTPQDTTSVDITDFERDVDAQTHLVNMTHVHLPKLADYGYIQWDRDSYELSKGKRFDEIRPLLQLLESHEDELPFDW
ncbi:transcriptional regulator [Halosimplex sp. TS25]|uniref:transcriptional regulator n=1 Tax=Halosimplex rarum TaxID=3396619 RepID=UPI0039E8C0E4